VVLASASAVSAVPYADVRAVLEAGPQVATAVVLGLDPATLGTTSVSVDPETGLVAMEGQFWYRGEYHLAAHHDGTLVRHDVVNVSGRGDGFVKLWQRGFLKGVEDDVRGFALALPHRVAAYGGRDRD
jgi:hypothetical protein